MMPASVKVALVHDWLTGMRGGEKVLEAACEMFPEAEIYTLIHNPDQISGPIKDRHVNVSWLNRFPKAHRYYRYLLPLMPTAIRTFDLSGYDLVLSSSHCVAKGVRIQAPQNGGKRPLHICYCHTPMRYIYDQFDDYFVEGSHQFLKFGAGLMRPYLRSCDQNTSGVNRFIANSENVRRRIQKIYGRDADVIYPPVNIDFFHPPTEAPLPQSYGKRPGNGSYYLIVGALVSYKRIDLAIEACRQINVPLKIVGRGVEAERLKKRAVGADVEFLGWKSDEDLRKLYQGCEALLFPQEEDFGIVPIEAMACGKPIIAYKKGGALESVKDGVTGLFFDDQTTEALTEAMLSARRTRFDPNEIRAHALNFDQKYFTSRLSNLVGESYDRHVRGESRAMPVRKKIKVLEVLECGGEGGTGNQVAAICNGLDPALFDVILVYSVRPGNDAAEYRAKIAGAQTSYLVPEMVREISLLSDLKALLRLRQIFRAEAPDVVHAHSSKAGALARLTAWLTDVTKVYYSPHGYSFLQSDRSAPSRLLYRWAEWCLSLIGEIIAVSPSEAQLAHRNGQGAPVHVVCDPYLGPVNPPELKSHSGLVIGACGRLTEARNPKAFVRLAAELVRGGSEARFVWIGSGEMEESTRLLATKLGVQNRFEITGWLKSGEVVKRMSGLDVLVHYSRWEGLPNAVQEAMSLGLPIVASDVWGNRDIVSNGETGFLVRSEAELARAVAKLLGDAELRRHFGCAGRERIKKDFTLEQALESLQSLYQK